MTELRLSNRLAKVAGLVPPGSVPADVGTDHAYVPIHLLLRGLCPRAWATDIHPGPLARAAAGAARYGVADRLTLVLCDGLALCPAAKIDTVILAGMGSETMLHILSAAPWALEKRLILQPQTKQEALADALARLGLGVRDAVLAEDAGRAYPVWLADRGAPVRPVEAVLAEKGDPLLAAWLRARLARLKKQRRGLAAARVPDQDALARTDAALAGLEKLLKGLSR